MKVKRIPETTVLNSENLSKILTNESSIVYVIENDIQRDYVWNIDNVATLWDEVFSCINENISYPRITVSKKLFDKRYVDLSTLEYSDVETHNKKDYCVSEINADYRSIVDGSQRCRTCMLMIMAFLYERAKVAKLEYVDLSPIMIDNTVYKLMEIGIDKLDMFYDIFRTTTVLEISKKIKPFEKTSNKIGEIHEEKDYFDIFNLFVNYIEDSIQLTIDKLNDALSIVLENTWFRTEYIPHEYKFSRFLDCNKRGTPMSDEDMYPKFIINKYKDEEKKQIYKAFQEFKEKAEDTTKNKRFRKTKKGTGPLLFIMNIVLKEKLSKELSKYELRKVFCSTFGIGNIEYGIEKCFANNKVFHTYQDAVNFFQTCSKVADFLNYRSFDYTGILSEENYYFKDVSKYNNVWWYFIAPLFFIDKDLTKDIGERIKNIMFAVFSFYSVDRASNTNSQNFINYLEEITEIILTEHPDTIIDSVLIRSKKFIENRGLNAMDTIPMLIFSNNRHKNAMVAIFRTIEYALCDRLKASTNSLYDMHYVNGKKQTWEMDHFLPRNKMPENAFKGDYDHIGNIVPLEGSLNASKQDNSTKNADYYKESKFLQTRFMNINARGELSVAQLNLLNSFYGFKRYTEIELNHPTKEIIDERTQNIYNFFVSFIKETLNIDDKTID